MRSTVDINVWVSAIISDRGDPARLERAFRAGRFTLITSQPLLDETEGVLLRPRLAARSGITPQKVSDILTVMRERAEIVEITGTLHVCRDPDDDVVIETAIVGSADVLVSGDADLHDDPPVRQLLQRHGIEAWTARRFAQWLELSGEERFR